MGVVAWVQQSFKSRFSDATLPKVEIIDMRNVELERNNWISEQLINEMMESDLKLMTKDQYLKDGGYNTMNFFE